MAWVTKRIELTEDYTLLMDNADDTNNDTGTKVNASNFFYVNSGSAEFYFSTDDPDDVPGMRVSAGARFMPVPVGSKLYGRLTKMRNNAGVKPYKDECIVFVSYEKS